MTVDEALIALERAFPHADIHVDEARTLTQPVMALASKKPKSVVDEVGEALIAHEMGVLHWQPVEAVRLILVIMARATPSLRLLESILNYLSMYFQELDDVVDDCRYRIHVGDPLADISRALTAALHQVDEIPS